MGSEFELELLPLDMTPYKDGNTGVDYVTTFDSGVPGPHAMVIGVVHGNELCGAHAVDFLMRQEVRPRRGRLSIGLGNVAAYESFDPENPTESRSVDQDFNRVWSPAVLDGPERNVELDRARNLRPIIDQVDLLLDLHSMQSEPDPLVLSGPLEKGRAFARTLGGPSLVVSDAGHAAGTRLRDYGAFGDPESDKNALLVECGQHWAKATAAVAIESSLRFLIATSTVDPEDVAMHLPATPPPPHQRVIEVTEAVTIESDTFRFVQPVKGLDLIEERGTLLAVDGERQIVTPYDGCVLIMPSRRLIRGQTAVRLGRYLD